MSQDLDRQHICLFIEGIYNDYRKILLRIISRYIADQDLRNDVYQDVFLQIIKRADFLLTLERPQLESYLLMMTRGTAIDYLKKNRYKEYVDLEDDVLIEIIEKQRRKALGACTATGKVELKMILEDVPADDLILILGKYYLGLSIDELAKLRGSNPATIRNRIHRIKKRISNKWRASNLRMEDFFDE